MSIAVRVADQVLDVADLRAATEDRVHKCDAFLNLLCTGKYAFQRDAVRAAWRFLISDQYPDLASLARANWGSREKEAIRQHHGSLDALLARMPLREKKAASLDLATGAGKSYVIYALAALALADGLVDRVLVLCPSLTIEDGLLHKFTAFIETHEFGAILRELGAAVAVPGLKRGNETVQRGDICIENIHAVYENAGSSIADSFRGAGGRTLVLNDEAHHIFSPEDAALKKWLKFLLNPVYDFRFIVNVTGTPYLGNDYFPDVVYRYGLKQAIAEHVVKKPNYKLEDTYVAHDWQKTYAIHRKNWADYGSRLKPITIVVTQEIARCVEVWRELINFLVEKEGISRADAERKAIWVTSGIPSGELDKTRVEAACPRRDDRDSPEKRRTENLALLAQVDQPGSPVEWIVSVSMLTEGWDVKNVFQIVPHESRAFNSKLLIAQVLGRGLRVPPGFEDQPYVTINNHEAWSGEIANLLKDILEVENTLSWGYEPTRAQYAFPLHNLRYEPKQTTVETKREPAREPQVTFQPQARTTTEYSTFSETGLLAVEISHRDLYDIEDAVAVMRLFIREKDEAQAQVWTKDRLRSFIVSALAAGGYDTTFLSKDNLLRLQQAFGPMFRELDAEHPRLSQIAQEVVPVEIPALPRQSFSESTLKEHSAVYYVAGAQPSFDGHEVQLWEHYQKARHIAGIDDSLLNEDVRQIVGRLHQVDLRAFKTPWNIHYASYEPERQFSDLLFANADLFDAFIKMPDRGGYAFPYSYKPAQAAVTHVSNENFNPDYFIRVRDAYDILVVEIKQEGDDSNRNRAKYRDGMEHFDTLNRRLTEAGELWRYHFYFLSPKDYPDFFDQVRKRLFAGWKSGLMQSLKTELG
jgi:type III restriction enzyme